MILAKERPSIDEILTDEIKLTTETVTRVEVIENSGRKYVKWDCKIKPRIQDDGRTLKIFVM